MFCIVINPIINNIVLTPDASKALDELGPFLALVCDYFQRGSKFLVVVGKPLQQWHAFDQLMFLPRLEIQSESGTRGITDNQCEITGTCPFFVVLTSLSVK